MEKELMKRDCPLKGLEERPYLGLFKPNTDGSSLGNPGLAGGIVFSEMSWATKSRDFLRILEIPLVSLSNYGLLGMG